MQCGLKYCVSALVAAFGIAVASAADVTPIPPKISHDTTHRLNALIDHSQNTIVDSTKSLSRLVEQLRECRQSAGPDKVVSILHIGDSHLQAGFLSDGIRGAFQREFGDAGRGMIIPLKLAKTNQPSDYQITSPNTWTGIKCVDRTIAEPVGIAGIDINTSDSRFEFTIFSQSEFCIVRAFHHEKAPMLYAPESFRTDSYCLQSNTPNSTAIMLNSSVNQIRLVGENEGEYDKGRFYGFSLENGKGGVLYHAVGINGATFGRYNTSSALTQQSAQLYPDLIIISLGTNDAYGSDFNSTHAYLHVDKFIKDLKKYNPGAAIIVTTPLCSDKKVYKNNVARYVVNPNMASMAEVIVRACKLNNVAYWDAYNICGAEKTCEKWRKEGLFQKDMLHLTKEGYDLKAILFFEAFANYYNSMI